MVWYDSTAVHDYDDSDTTHPLQSTSHEWSGLWGLATSWCTHFESSANQRWGSMSFTGWRRIQMTLQTQTVPDLTGPILCHGR